MRRDPRGSGLRNVIREPRLVVAIIFDVGSIYISSRSGIANIPGTEIEAALVGVSTTSQSLEPDRHITTVGSMAIQIADLGGALTAEIRDQLSGQGQGIRGREVRLFCGDTDDFDDGTWSRVATQIVTSDIEYTAGGYQIRCSDRTRELRSEIFEPATTHLLATLSETDTEVIVESTDGFERVEHTASFTESPNQTVGYAWIPKTGEIFRYTGKATGPARFTGVTRGVLSVAQRIEVNDQLDAERQPVVEEFIYYEMPGPQMLYAFMTGYILGTTIQIPAHHNLGIPTSLVDSGLIQSIGRDLYDISDLDGGLVLRLVNPGKVDGKQFIEEHILGPMWCFLRVGTDGRYQLKRLARQLSDASYAVQITQDLVDGGSGPPTLVHKTDDLINKVDVLWNWDGEEYTRTTRRVNFGSVITHQKVGARELKYKTLAVTRHNTQTIQRVFDSFTDRYGAPPLEMSLPVMPSLNHLEIGEVVRVTLPEVRDYASISTLDRTFEIRRTTMDWVRGKLSFDLFGSSAEQLPDDPTEAMPLASQSLSDEWFESEGTELSTVLTIVGGVITANGTLTGGSSMSADASIFYYDGDLDLGDGVEIAITGNIQLRINGAPNFLGAIDGRGGGRPGIASPDIDGLPPFVYSDFHKGAFFGVTQASDSVIFANQYQNWPGMYLTGQHTVVPELHLSVENGALLGIPGDMRGVEGGYGYPVVDNAGSGEVIAPGGNGGASGAALMIICRDTPSFGLSAEIDLSGGDGGAPPGTGSLIGTDLYGGAGAGGHPGSLYILIDNPNASLPDLSNVFVALRGNTPQTGTPGVPGQRPGSITFPSSPGTGMGPGLGDSDHYFSAHRVQWVPQDVALGEGSPEQLPQPVITGSAGTQFGVALTIGSIPEAEYDVVEVWGSITSSRSDATLLYSGRGNQLLVPLDRLTTYYLWLRTRQGARVSEWDTEDGTTVAGGGQIIPPISLSDVFAETFDAYDTQEDFERYWEIVVQSSTGSIEFTQNGQNGGKAMRVTGSLLAVWRENIPYDPTGPLYRLETRVRQITAAAGNQSGDIGLLGVKSDGLTIIDMLGGTNKQNFMRSLASFNMDELPNGEWLRSMNWLRGTNETSDALGFIHDSGTALWDGRPQLPRLIRKAGDGGVPRYMRPVIRLNWLGAAGVAEIDHYIIKQRDLAEMGQLGFLDPSFSLVDDEQYWILTGGTAAGVYDVGAGIDGKNALRADLDGVSSVVLESRYTMQLIGDTIAIRIQYKINGGIVANPTITCTLLGYTRLSYQSTVMFESVGSVTSSAVSFGSLTVDDDWHAYTFTFSNVLTSGLDDADLFVPRFILQSGNAGNTANFWLGRARLAQA